MTEALEDAAGCPVDIEGGRGEGRVRRGGPAGRGPCEAAGGDEEPQAEAGGPLQFEMSIQAEDLAGYVPSFGWEMSPPSDKQVQSLEKWGIRPDEIECAGKASLLLDRLAKRRSEGLTTPKQIRFLEGKGFQHVGQWQFEEARNMIDRIASQGWKIPAGVTPSAYVPVSMGG